MSRNSERRRERFFVPLVSLNSRHSAPTAASAAEGWAIERLTPPSRLFCANGLRTGKDGRVYVAQVAGSQVSAIDVDTGEIETIIPIGGAMVGPDDLVFDDEDNLYVTEITENQVRVLRPNGTSDVIADLRVANPITHHQGHLIAGELVMGGRIMEIDRNGGAPRVILDNIPMVNAFDVGPDGKLYFPAQGANEIWRISLDGGEPEVVAKDLGVPDSVKFHPDGYIVSTQVYSGQVLKIDPRTGEKSVLADIGPGLDNVTFVGKRIFVSHITGSIHEIVAPGRAKALVDKGLQWPLGLAVGADGELFVADGGFTYTLRPGGNMKLIGMLFSPGFPGWVRDVTAVGEGTWIVTTANGDVASWRPAAQQHEKLVTGYDRLMGVASGPGGAVVFAEMPTGRVLSWNGGNTSELARGLDRPMGVAIGPDAVYVAEAGAGCVTKLSGAKREAVIDGLAEPHGLAVTGGKLYTLDVGAKQLIESDLSGGARRVIASDLPVGAPPGVIAKQLGGVGDLCGPMHTFSGLAAGADGTIYIAADGEGSVLAVRAL
jgi:sugar lactone lactonase YvrE